MNNLTTGDNRTKTRIRSLASLMSQRGSAAVDYAVILVFVVLAALAAIVTLQDQSEEIFKTTGTVIGDFGSIKTE